MEYRTLHEIVRQARHNLARNQWDYLIGGADSESSLRRNRYGLDSLAYRPRILNDVSEVDAGGALLGVPLRIPVLLGPIGSLQLFDPRGGEAAAEAARDFGVLQILSSVCLPDFESVAAAVPGPRIYQLYLMGDEAWMDDVIGRTVQAGYTALCLTADTQTYSRRERDILKGYVPPSGSRVSGREASAGLEGTPTAAAVQPAAAQPPAPDFTWQARMSWDTIAHVKASFDLPLVVKGVATAEDAARCVEAGVDVVYVSNHGGRQLDHTRACIDVLPEVVKAVAGRVPVVVDGGFMRGADVVKALCLGASAVGLGRLEGLALAAGGAAALVRALEILEHEIRVTMALLGAATREALHPGLLERAQPVNAPGVLSAFPLLDEDY